MIQDNKDLPWTDDVYSNPSVTWGDIKDIDICWKKLSENPNLNWIIVSNNINKPWDFGEVSCVL